MGIHYVQETPWAIARAERDVHYQNVIHQYWVEALTESYCWQLVEIAPALTSDALTYLRPKTDEEGHRVAKHVAMHVRRGDHKYMNCFEKIDKKGRGQLNSAEADALMRQWTDGDFAVEDL